MTVWVWNGEICMVKVIKFHLTHIFQAILLLIALHKRKIGEFSQRLVGGVEHSFALRKTVSSYLIDAHTPFYLHKNLAFSNKLIKNCFFIHRKKQKKEIVK